MSKLFYLLLSLMLAGSCNKNNSNPPAPEPYPKISIDDVTLFEGNGGTSSFSFRVSLDVVSTKVVSVNYSTTEGTARINEDFTPATNQTINFQPGEKEKTLVVPVVADASREGDDDFTVTLSSPVNGALLKATAVGTIRNDDVLVAFSNAGYDAPASYAGYTRVWADEFDGPSLDNTAWTNQDGDGCPNLCGWGNNELEYYTSRPQNLFFQDGKMIIEARKENFSTRGFTSSKIVSSGNKTFKFGRIDIRAKLPKGKGIWPAFWMLPQSNVFGGWPRSGEIDIMEMVGHEPAKVYGTLHFGPGPGSIQIGKNYTLPSGTFNDEFHVFSLEWKQDQIRWFVDGNLFGTAVKTDFGANNYPFNEDFYFIINLAVGGNWPGNPDAATYFPQWLIVDYVRVYQ